MGTTGVLFFVLFTFMVMVLLLNMLIAIVSDSYDYAMIRSKQLFLRARIELAAELVVIGYARSTLEADDVTPVDPTKYAWIDRSLSCLKPFLAPKLYKMGLAVEDV